VLKIETEPLAPSSGNNVTIKMLFAPINPADINMIQGSYPIQPALPGIGGNEGLGEVLSVGSDVSGLSPGDLVIPNKQGFGTWRSHATCDASDLLKLPSVKGVKQEYLATLVVNPATAYRMLEDFVQLKEGDVIIQNGANSMVGTSVIQLAALKGVKTINIIRPRTDYDDLVEKLKGYGAYMVVTDKYATTPEFKKLISDLPKPKLALNCVGGETATEMARLLTEGGTMVTYGGMSIRPVTIPTRSFIFNDITLKGFWMSRWYSNHSIEEKTKLLNTLIELVQDNKLRLWTERHQFVDGFDVALERAQNTQSRDRKVLFMFDNKSIE